MASTVTFSASQPLLLLLLRSNFLGRTQPYHRNLQTLTARRQSSNYSLKPSAKFDPFEILGGRGLLKGEQGLQLELQRKIEQPKSPASETGQGKSEKVEEVEENEFEKEMMGLTGGFPGGEKGLKKFIQQNPPPPKSEKSNSDIDKVAVDFSSLEKPEPPQLPVLMPGMIAIVKNSNSPYYMYCGIVQRITDGKAGVLFEGGNWDRLITFRLEELERREKGPPMKNPRSAILEPLLNKDSN